MLAFCGVCCFACFGCRLTPFVAALIGNLVATVFWVLGRFAALVARDFVVREAFLFLSFNSSSSGSLTLSSELLSASSGSASVSVATEPERFRFPEPLLTTDTFGSCW